MEKSKLKFKISNNKGVAFDEALPAVVTIILAAFVFFGFKMHEGKSDNKIIDDIQRQKDILNGNKALMDYLETIEDNGETKAAFISKSIGEKNYKVVKEDITKYFSKRLADLEWYIDIKDSSKNFILPSLTNTQYPKNANLAASALIPVNGNEPSYISIELFIAK